MLWELSKKYPVKGMWWCQIKFYCRVDDGLNTPSAPHGVESRAGCRVLHISRSYILSQTPPPPLKKWSAFSPAPAIRGMDGRESRFKIDFYSFLYYKKEKNIRMITNWYEQKRKLRNEETKNLSFWTEGRRGSKIKAEDRYERTKGNKWITRMN